MIFVYIVAGSLFFSNVSAFTIGKRSVKEDMTLMNTIGDVRKLPTGYQYDENDSSVKFRKMLHSKNIDDTLSEYSKGRPLKKITNNKPVMLNASIITNRFHKEEASLRGIRGNLKGSIKHLNQIPGKSYYKPKEIFTLLKDTVHSSRKKRGLLDTLWTAKDLISAGSQIVTNLTPEQNGILAGQATKYAGHLAKNYTSGIANLVGDGIHNIFKKSGLGLLDVFSGNIRRVGGLTGSTVGLASDITGQAIITAGKLVDTGYKWLKLGQGEGNLSTLEHPYLRQKIPEAASQRSNSFNGNKQNDLVRGNNLQKLPFSKFRNKEIIKQFPCSLVPHQERKHFHTVLKNKVDTATASTVKRYDLSNLGVLKSINEANPGRNYPTGTDNGRAINEERHRSKRGLVKYYKIMKGLLGAGSQLATSLTPQEYSTLAGEGLKVLGQMGGEYTEQLIKSVGGGVKTYLSNAGLEGVDYVSGGLNALGTVSGKAITTTSNIAGETIKYVGSAFDKGYQTGKTILGILG